MAIKSDITPSMAHFVGRQKPKAARGVDFTNAWRLSVFAPILGVGVGSLDAWVIERLVPSNPAQEISHWCFHGFGDPHQSLDGDELFATLDFSEVLRV
jgi:hypothetical protein